MYFPFDGEGYLNWKFVRINVVVCNEAFVALNENALRKAYPKYGILLGVITCLFAIQVVRRVNLVAELGNSAAVRTMERTLR